LFQGIHLVRAARILESSRSAASRVPSRSTPTNAGMNCGGATGPPDVRAFAVSAVDPSATRVVTPSGATRTTPSRLTTNRFPLPSTAMSPQKRSSAVADPSQAP
jgi:hypothetical protein